MADVNQLELALLNLATNARDAMPNGGTITISSREAEASDGNRLSSNAGRYVCLSVSDTGLGMDEVTLASAMDPFFTTKGLGKGTGLGLSMVHGFIEQLGGRFILKSRKDHGTTAEMWLPVALEGSASARVVEQNSTPDIPRLCVLVIDDDSLVLTSTCLLLEDLGHRVISATSGRQGLELFEVNPSIDLVITDMAMPQMSGAQLADAIRRLKPDVPIILATGYAERLEGFAAGLPRLSKPFTQLNLVETIASAMK
jgi:CheY-like chemotaxis protein